MAEIFAKLKRGWWLYKSAGLTFPELANLAANKVIYFLTWAFYSLKSFVYFRKFNMIAGYGRHIPPAILKQDRKRALMAYLPMAFYKENFIGRIKYYFSNNGSTLAIGRALNELGYELDIIGNDDADFEIKKHYDLVFLHNVKLIDVYRKKLPKETKIIYFEVVAYWRAALENLQKRYKEFSQRHKVNVPLMDLEGYQKIAEEGEAYDRAIEAADGRIVMGDQLVNTFKGFSRTFFTTSGCIKDEVFRKDLSPENLQRGKINFVFFGGSFHNLRKGLHLLFEAFTGTPYHLYVCSSVYPFLLEAYNINRQPNIHLLGYQKQGTKQFYDLMNSCTFVIHPSCAEGIPGGVLDTMKYGLIPIVSRECNIVNAKTIGRQLESSSVEEIRQSLDFAAGQSSDWLAAHARMAIAETEQTYSVRAFINDIKAGVVAIVTSK